MPRSLLRAAAAGAVALFAGLLTAPAAQADNGEFFDVHGHINYVRVTHGPATVGIYAQDNGITIDAHHHFWIDTNSSNPGPEYKATASQATGRAYVMKVANFDSSGIKFSCPGFTAELHHFHEGYVKVIIPRSCVATPAAVKVTAVGYYDEDNDGHVDVVDWAPGKRRAYPPVSR
jgi:hypothetical protein